MSIIKSNNINIITTPLFSEFLLERFLRSFSPVLGKKHRYKPVGCLYLKTTIVDPDKNRKKITSSNWREAKRIFNPCMDDFLESIKRVHVLQDNPYSMHITRSSCGTNFFLRETPIGWDMDYFSVDLVFQEGEYLLKVFSKGDNSISVKLNNHFNSDNK